MLKKFTYNPFPHMLVFVLGNDGEQLVDMIVATNEEIKIKGDSNS